MIAPDEFAEVIESSGPSMLERRDKSLCQLDFM